MSGEKRTADRETADKFKKLKLVEEDKEKEEEEEEESDDEQDQASSSVPNGSNYPGILGENSEYVRLVSCDHHEFYIRRDLAERSKTIKDMLRSPCGNHNNTVFLHMVNSKILQKMCNYLSYQKQYLKKQGEIEPFEIDPDDSYDLLLVAGFFEI